jgi:hypothetical protein
VPVNNSKVVGILFEDKQRESPEKKSHIDSDWDYLDSSGRVEAQRVRAFLTRWCLSTLMPNVAT